MVVGSELPLVRRLEMSPTSPFVPLKIIGLNDVMFGGGLGSEGKISLIDSERPSPTRAPQPQ